MTPVPQLNLPPNAPPAVLNLAIQQVVQVAVAAIDPVECQLITSVIESRRLASREVMRGRILASRMTDLNVKAVLVLERTGWEKAMLPTPPVSEGEGT